MIDWKKVYVEVVAPVIKNTTSPPPIAVTIILIVLLLGGTALIIWTSGKGRIIGIMLIGIVIFIAYMLISSYFRVKNNDAHFEIGTIMSKFTKTVMKKDSQGYSREKKIYYIEMDVVEAYILTIDGQGKYLRKRNGKYSYSVDNSIYNQLQENDTINAIFMPGIDKSIHAIVQTDGGIIK